MHTRVGPLGVWAISRLSALGMNGRRASATRVADALMELGGVVDAGGAFIRSEMLKTFSSPTTQQALPLHESGRSPLDAWLCLPEPRATVGSSEHALAPVALALDRLGVAAPQGLPRAAAGVRRAATGTVGGLQPPRQLAEILLQLERHALVWRLRPRRHAQRQRLRCRCGSSGSWQARCSFGAKGGACVHNCERYSSQHSLPIGEPRSGGRAARTTCSAARPPSQRRRQRRYTARRWRCGRRHAPTAAALGRRLGVAAASGWARSCRPRRPSRPNCWLQALTMDLLLVTWTRWVPKAQARALQQLLPAAVPEGRAPDAQAWRPHNPWW